MIQRAVSWQRDERGRGREEEKNRTPQTAFKGSLSVKEVNDGNSCVGGLEKRVGRREKESGKIKRYLLDGLLFILCLSSYSSPLSFILSLRVGCFSLNVSVV